MIWGNIDLLGQIFVTLSMSLLTFSLVRVSTKQNKNGMDLRNGNISKNEYDAENDNLAGHTSLVSKICLFGFIAGFVLQLIAYFLKTL